MKKLFFAMAAMAAMLTSCSKDDAFGGLSHGKVTFEVSTPELTTRAYGDGKTATTLHYAVYDMVEDVTNGKLVKYEKLPNKLSELKTTVTIDLVEGRTYEVAFWAESPESPYVFEPEEKKVCYKQIDNLTANNENYDAFFAYYGDDEGENVTVGGNVSVTLTRPFAQLNVATNDTIIANNLDVEVNETGIEVYAYTSLNLKSGNVSEPETLDFALNGKMAGELANDFDWLTMNYILVKERANVGVTFNFSDELGRNYTRQYTAVPVERNHRTNILGKVLTDPTIFSVDIDHNMAGDDIIIGDFLVGSDYYTDFAVAVAKAIEEKKILTLMQNALFDVGNKPITIDGGATLTINLNGHTICGVTDNDDVASLFVVNGTLIVKNVSYGSANAATSAAPAALTTRAVDTRGTITFEKDDAAIFTVANGGTLTINNANIISSDIPVIVDNSGDGQIVVNISDSKLTSGGNSPAFWVKDNSDAKLDNLSLNIFDDVNNNTFEGDIKFGDGDTSYTVNNKGYQTDNKTFWNGYYDVNSWDEFTAALAANATKIKLKGNITYEGSSSYNLKNDVVVEMNGKTFTTGNASNTWLNIMGSKATFKGGIIEGKVYVQKNGGTYSDATFDNVTFGGTITFSSVTQGSLAVQGGNSVYAKKCTFNGKGSSTPNVVSLEGTSSGSVIFEDCTFNSSMNRFYANPIGGTAIFKLLNCSFNKAAVVETAATLNLNNLVIDGSKKQNVNLYIGKSKESLTDEEKVILDYIKTKTSGTVYCNGVKY